MKFEIKNFNLKHTLECGQCFRWEKIETREQYNYEYIGIIEDRVIKIKQDKDLFYVWSNKQENLKEVIFEYFDLNRDYGALETEIATIDKNVEKTLEYSSGLHILKQPVFETLISYIISSNNNIKRISSSIKKLSEMFGEKVIFENKVFYLFPTFERLNLGTPEDYALCGVGFRNKYIKKTLMLLENKEKLDSLSLEETKNIREELLKFSGVGPKVADCIMLFSMQKIEVFPIDVWVKRIMEKLYFESETHVENIMKYARYNFGKYAGVVQQQLFYNIREKQI